MITTKNDTQVYYGILKDDSYLYDGAKVVGHDSEGIKRVYNPKWIDYIPVNNINEYHLFVTVNQAIDTLKGLMKYSNEEGSELKVVEIDIFTEAKIVPGVVMTL
jgi:hypothetical protein